MYTIWTTREVSEIPRARSSIPMLFILAVGGISSLAFQSQTRVTGDFRIFGKRNSKEIRESQFWTQRTISSARKTIGEIVKSWHGLRGLQLCRMSTSHSCFIR